MNPPNLQIAPTLSFVSPGSTVEFRLTLSNSPSSAFPNATTAITFMDLDNTLPVGALFQRFSAPPGWSCRTPPVGATGQLVTCTATPSYNSEPPPLTFAATVQVPSDAEIGEAFYDFATGSLSVTLAGPVGGSQPELEFNGDSPPVLVASFSGQAAAEARRVYRAAVARVEGGGARSVTFQPLAQGTCPTLLNCLELRVDRRITVVGAIQGLRVEGVVTLQIPVVQADGSLGTRAVTCNRANRRGTSACHARLPDVALQPAANGTIAGTVVGGMAAPTPTRTATPSSRPNYLVLVPPPFILPPPPPPPAYVLPPPGPGAARLAPAERPAAGEQPPASTAPAPTGAGGEVPVVPEAESAALLAVGLAVAGAVVLLRRPRRGRR